MTSRIRLAPRNTDAGDEQRTERCERCEGEGAVAEMWQTMDWGADIVQVECPDCGGSGRVSYWRDEGAGE